MLKIYIIINKYNNKININLYINLLYSISHTSNTAECISLSFLLYYSNFSLLLCSECCTALFSDTFSFHVKSHYKQHAEKEK